TPPPPPVPTPPPPPVPTPPPPSPDDPRYVVEGRVASRTRPAAAGLRVRIVDKGVGGDAPLAEGTTDASGRFQASFLQSGVAKRGKDRPDLQARVFSGAASVGASAIRYNASRREILDVLLDDKASGALPSEYEALISSLSRHHRGPLAELQESADRQDITYLSQKSGWDARSVALAALADQFSARTRSPVTATRIEPPLFYALFRAGLAADETSIYRLAPAAVENVWKQAIVQGVVPPAFEARLPSALAYFQEVAAQRLLQGPAVVGASSFRDLAAGTLKEGFQQQQFAELYSRFGNDSEALWRNVREKFGEAVTNRLRLDGQLAYLTLNNAPLIGRLHAQAGRSGLDEAAQLVESGFYRPDRWLGVIGDSPVPPEIPGRDLEERSGRYAELLAAQIRLSFPTAVVAEMVRNGETPLASEPLAERVHAFLAGNGGKFEIGAQPVARYAALNGLELEPEVVREVSRIQRVYQITPDDQAMNGLLREGVDSASAAMRYEPEEFIRAFAGAVGGEANARLVHAKARQVHSAVLNVAIGYLTAKAAPGIGVHSPPSIVNPAPSPLDHADDVLAYATLEGLFGEMDYCACDHCRSVLSPAAYLVDLLTFIDRPASEIPAGFLNPLTVLRARRPDIEHLPLTCENTNTPLPYIDLVNETLEHYVANGLSLALYVGHNTDGSIPAEELLASPQFVSDIAYSKLATETFPPPLPFQQPLEYLRRCFARFDAPLAHVMEDLRVDDIIDRTGSAEFDWRDIRMEAIGLSRPEHRLLTERWLTGLSTDVMLTVKHLYGFDPATPDADVRAVLDNAK
ncbi:MAG TPA: hypothetical protein VEW26_09790, partial [Allosphingosinicella sp.]|nr:hypothetical protein [Allosphingosinicella sp.]